MALIDRITRRQVATYWPPADDDEHDSHGETIFGPPQEIGCFWMDMHELFLTSGGAQEVSNAKVIVDTDLQEGGMLRLGDLDSLTYEPDPLENDDVFIIRKFERMPANLKVTKFYRVAIL